MGQSEEHYLSTTRHATQQCLLETVFNGDVCENDRRGVSAPDWRVGGRCGALAGFSGRRANRSEGGADLAGMCDAGDGRDQRAQESGEIPLVCCEDQGHCFESDSPLQHQGHPSSNKTPLMSGEVVLTGAVEERP